MIETALRESKNLSVRTHTNIKTPIGIISQYDVVVKGYPLKLYSLKKHNYDSLKNDAELIKNTEKNAQSDSAKNKYAEKGTSSHEIINKESPIYAEKLINKNPGGVIKVNDLFPVIENNALGIIYKAAENTQNNPAGDLTK